MYLFLVVILGGSLNSFITVNSPSPQAAAALCTKLLLYPEAFCLLINNGGKFFYEINVVSPCSRKKNKSSLTPCIFKLQSLTTVKAAFVFKRHSQVKNSSSLTYSISDNLDHHYTRSVL